MRADIEMVKEENFEKPYYKEPAPREYKIVWIMVAYMVYVHIAALYGLYLAITRALWTTLAFTFMMHILASLGVTAGAHRLWTHKTYKAKIPLEIFLMMCHSSSNTFTTITWIRNHMLHHKYTDTDADPHNSTRGFFYCHVGWLLVKKHPEARAKGKEIDLTELYTNPVLRFQQKHAFWLVPSIAFFIPSVVPLIWNEALTVAYHLNILRVTITLNASMMVNSVAHMWGTRPYDKSILPVQNKIVSFIAFGEGFHNYHHVFPQDYRTAELGDNYLNPTTKFIDFCAWIGQAYDLKYVTDDVIAARARRTGDKSKGNN